jgi:hypothetical protein
MSLLSITYRGILVLLLFINFVVLEIFDFNVFGLIVLLFGFFFYILRLTTGPLPNEAVKTYPDFIIKIRRNVGWKKNLLVASISIVIAMVAFIATIIIAFGGSPIEMWPISFVFLALYALTIFAYRLLRTNMIIIQTLIVLIILLFTYEHLHVSKALWPNKEGKIFGLSNREYNMIQSAGWDWGEEWTRVKVSKEELPKVIEQFSYYKLDPIIKDSIKVVPSNAILGIRGVHPYHKIKTPCLHWYRESNSSFYSQKPLHVYYDENTETLLVTEVTEF